MMAKRRSWNGIRRAAALALMAAALAGCTPPAAPPAQSASPDEALQGHAQWCGTNPPSGYCSIDDKR